MSNFLQENHNTPDGANISRTGVQLPDTGITNKVMMKSAPEMQYEREDMSVFFGIGMTINVIMIVAFFVWAVKQWKKHD